MLQNEKGTARSLNPPSKTTNDINLYVYIVISIYITGV